MLRDSGGSKVVHIKQLALGALLAEGGEGRVFEVEREAEPLAYKQFRRPQPAAQLAQTVAFPEQLEQGLASRVRASSAWPVAVVVGDDPAVALGALMPRAPAAFWLRHREGQPRLATLSYLASDPDRITVAYGIVVPGPGAPGRVGVVYALARLLEAWQHDPGAPPRSLVVHGDLSAKNVLWSLDPVPAVYVLDCDGATVLRDGVGGASNACFASGGVGSGGVGSGGACDELSADKVRAPSRATTPNWDDPALSAGAPPGACSDRYALGLAFLRVVGAAHFPLQARQRSGEKISVDLEVPRSWRRLADMSALWELCARSLSVVGAADRPSPTEWAQALEGLLAAMGSASLAARIRALQGDPRASTGGSVAEPVAEAKRRPAVTVPDVCVQPVVRQRASSTWALVNPTGPPGSPAQSQGGAGLAGIGLVSGLGLRQLFQRVGLAWAGAHRLAFRLLRSRGRRRDGLHRLARVLALDLAAACLLLFLVGMIVSPWIGL